MNTEGCLPGMFTDEILFFSSSIRSCDSPVAGYVVFITLLFILRVIVAFTQTRFWIKRSRIYKQKEKDEGKATASWRNRRYPFIPVLSTFATVFEFIFIILTTLNVANTRNSISVLLLGLFYLPVIFDHAILIRRYVRLGNRLLPKSVAGNAGQMKHLSVNDTVLNTLLFGLVTTASMVIVLSILAPAVMPGNPLLFQIMCGAVGIYQACAAFSVIWQMRRCQIAISQTNVSDIMLSDPNRSKASIDYAVKKMRQQQLICFVIAILGIVVNLLIASRVIPVTWWVICLTQFGYENGFEMFSVLNMVRNGKKRPMQGKRLEGTDMTMTIRNQADFTDNKEPMTTPEDMDVVFASKKGLHATAHAN
jgi:hypothetical protein